MTKYFEGYSKYCDMPPSLHVRNQATIPVQYSSYLNDLDANIFNTFALLLFRLLLTVMGREDSQNKKKRKHRYYLIEFQISVFGK
jgi:hypothetical protein